MSNWWRKSDLTKVGTKNFEIQYNIKKELEDGKYKKKSGLHDNR